MRTESFTQPWSGVQKQWTYIPSRAHFSTHVRRHWARFSRRPGAKWAWCKPATWKSRWIVYFAFVPDGKLTPAHQFTLDRLAAEDAGLMVICACPPESVVLDQLAGVSDALLWKDEAGWDFSAYALGLYALARLSPGADVLLLNDSVLGPFRPLVPLMDHSPWRLTGFTGNAQFENHVQSYAFILKAVDLALVAALKPVISTEWAYNAIGPVILRQETQLARTAHQHMSVGAHHFTDGSHYEDLCLNCPELLLDDGFPFLKRSLFGKFAGLFQPPQSMGALLRRLGHPEMTSRPG